jgi:hypothetical protein
MKRIPFLDMKSPYREMHDQLDAAYRRLNSEPRFEMMNMRSFKGVDIYTFVPK